MDAKNGMSTDPIEVGGYTSYSTQKGDKITSVHTVPVEQFIHAITEDGSCLCGPNIEYLHGGEFVKLSVVHLALDASYWEASHEDWGPDGPVDI